MPDFDLDAALTPDEPKDSWEHVHGDVNGWTYGAMWYNAAKENVIAVRGIEDEPEIWAHEIPFHRGAMDEWRDMAEQKFPGPEDAEEREEWVEQAAEQWREEERERLVDAQTQEVFEWSCDDCVDDYDTGSIIRSFGIDRDDWDALELYVKWLYIADHYGLHEMDPHPVRLTRAQLQARLGATKLR